MKLVRKIGFNVLFRRLTVHNGSPHGDRSLVFLWLCASGNGWVIGTAQGILHLVGRGAALSPVSGQPQRAETCRRGPSFDIGGRSALSGDTRAPPELLSLTYQQLDIISNSLCSVAGLNFSHQTRPEALSLPLLPAFIRSSIDRTTSLSRPTPETIFN